MPKKLKLDLNGLKVNSFVTSLGNRDREKIKGGVDPTDFGSCSCDGGCQTKYMLTCPECFSIDHTCETCDCPSINTCEICTETLNADLCNT